MSNGGFLVNRLACEAADVIAAVAPVAALLGIDDAACNPARPIPIIAFNGTGDPLVLYDGGGVRGLPGGDFGESTTDIDANEVMWELFSRTSL